MVRIELKAKITLNEICAIEKQMRDLIALINTQNLILKQMLKQAHPILAALIHRFLVLNIEMQESLLIEIKRLDEIVFEALSEDNISKGQA